MRALLVVVAAAACGSPAGSRRAEPIGNAISDLARSPSTPRLLPGSVGLAVEEVAVTGGCVERRTQIRRIADGDDATFVAAMTVDPLARTRGTRLGAPDLKDWMQAWSARIAAATERLIAVITDDRAAAPARVEALARLAQLLDQAGETLPAIGVVEALAGDPDVVDQYCDVLDQQAASFHARADETRARCRDLAAELAVAPGWWTSVCAAR